MGLSTSDLLAVNASHSVMLKMTAPSLPATYCPYGTLNSGDRRRGLPAFNGMLLEGNTQGYLLGNGYRLYRPQLRRFTRPDEFSPFGRGGLNGYAYCEGDPVNYVDPSGESIFSFLTTAISNALAYRGPALVAMFSYTALDFAKAIVTRPGPVQMVVLRARLIGAGVAAAGYLTGSRHLLQAGTTTAVAGTAIELATIARNVSMNMGRSPFAWRRARDNAAAIFGFSSRQSRRNSEFLTDIIAEAPIVKTTPFLTGPSVQYHLDFRGPGDSIRSTRF